MPITTTFAKEEEATNEVQSEISYGSLASSRSRFERQFDPEATHTGSLDWGPACDTRRPDIQGLRCHSDGSRPSRPSNRSFLEGPFRTNTNPDEIAEAREAISAYAYAFHHEHIEGRHPDDEGPAADFTYGHMSGIKAEQSGSVSRFLDGDATPRHRLEQPDDKAKAGCAPRSGTKTTAVHRAARYLKRHMGVSKVGRLLRSSSKQLAGVQEEVVFGVPAAPSSREPFLSKQPENMDEASSPNIAHMTSTTSTDFRQDMFDRQVSKSSSGNSKSAAPEGSDFTWICVFPLPMATTEEDQRCFDTLLWHEKLTHCDALEDAFGSFMAKDAVRGALACALNYNDEEAGLAWATQARHKLQRRRTMTNWLLDPHMPAKPWLRRSLSQEELTQFTLTKARQCTVELMLAYIHTFGKSCKEYFECQHEKDLRNKKEFGTPLSSKEHVTVFKFTSEDKDLMYLCARMSAPVAELHAEIEQYPLQLSREGLKELGIKVSDTDTSPAYVKFERKFRNLFQKYEDAYDVGTSCVLRHKDRIRIFYDKLTESVNVALLESVGLMAHSFPLHHAKTVDHLGRTWGNWWLLFSLKQPLDDVRAYFGEEIGFYFLFLHEAVRATAVLNIPAWILYFCHSHGGKSFARPILAVVILIWYRIFTKKWQRTEALVSNRWGGDVHSVSTIKKLRNTRFKGQMLPAPDNEEMLRPQVTRRVEIIGRTCSLLLSSAFVVALFVVVALEHYVLFKLEIGRCARQSVEQFYTHLASVAVGGLFGAQIKAVDVIWDRMSDWITDLEYRSMKEDFDWSKRVKASVVKFVTSIITVVFSAFAQPFLETEATGSLGTRPSESQTERQRSMLEHQLFSLFVTRYMLFYGAVNDVLMPWLKLRIKQKRHGDDWGNPVENQVEMLTYGNYELTNDYLDILLPLGFVTFFGMIYPPSALLLLLVLIIRVRADAWKLLNVYRRPYPHVAKDIGVFNAMLGLFGHGMIMTNLGLIMVDFGGVARILHFEFNPPYMKLWGMQVRTIRLLDTLLFLALALPLSLTWHLLEFVLDDESNFVRIEQQRQDLQRHILSYTGFKGVDMRKMVLTSDPTAKRRDFSRLPTYAEAAESGDIHTSASTLSVLTS